VGPTAGLDDFKKRKKNLLRLPGFEPRLVQPLVTVPTMHSRLLLRRNRCKMKYRPRTANFTTKLRDQQEIRRCCCFCADRTGRLYVLRIPEDSGTEDSREEAPSTKIGLRGDGTRISEK
jgi:hypothetical protein